MNSHNAITSRKSENLTTFLYNLLENVSEISFEVKDMDVCIATQQGRSHSKTD